MWKVKTVARLAQSVEHETLNLRVVGSSPTLGEHFIILKPLILLCKLVMGSYGYYFLEESDQLMHEQMTNIKKDGPQTSEGFNC